MFTQDYSTPTFPVTVEKPDVFSLAGLIAWLETQDPATEYEYSSCDTCLLANFFIAMGEARDTRDVIITPGGHLFGNGTSKQYPRVMDKVAAGGPRNYGAALTRARALVGRK